MVIDCSQITAVLCNIQILTAVLTAIIVGFLKKRFWGYYNSSSFFRLRVFQNKGKVCIVSLQGISLEQDPVVNGKKLFAGYQSVRLRDLITMYGNSKKGLMKAVVRRGVRLR